MYIRINSNLNDTVLSNIISIVIIEREHLNTFFLNLLSIIKLKSNIASYIFTNGNQASKYNTFKFTG